MKKTYHLCLSAGNEVMFRDQEDYNKGFNYFALALYKTSSTGLVEAFMSTHCHMLVQTEDPAGFMFAMRKPYSLYFNRKYGRTGRLGERRHFEMEVQGLHHHLAAMSYILRNPLHHGIAPIPYTYCNSTINAIFREEMGRPAVTDILSHKSIYKHIGRKVSCPPKYRMSKSGVFLRDSVMDIAQVENMFATPRGFNYYMGRKTSEEWEKEQEKDKLGQSPITLLDIEQGIEMHTEEVMLNNEKGRMDYKKMTDIELCTEIDLIVNTRFNKQSVYHLTMSEKTLIADYYRKEKRLPEAQIRRCLAIF